MTDMNKMNVEALENVAGGEWRQVNTRTVQNGVLRCGPGTSYERITSYPNGTWVTTTGRSKYNPDDGRTWYELDSPDYGWTAGRIVGLPE